MALNSSRSAWSLSRQPLLRPLCARRTVAAPPALSQTPPAATRTIAPRRTPSSCRQSHDLARSPTALREQDDPLNEPISQQDLDTARPRWSYTPEALKRTHDFSLNPIKDPRRSIWPVNEDPAKLDAFYERFLGRGGERMLPEEVRWLAVTHKSFDYGRRGFNTRLAFFGRQILVLEAMNHIMTRSNTVEQHIGDPWNRTPFKSPALSNVDKLSVTRPQDAMSIQDLANVAHKSQLGDVLRWKPRNPFNLKSSGLDTVLATTVFAIVGAVALQQGGEVANRIARERVIQRISRSTDGA